MMTSLKLKWMEKHKVLHCFILINLQQPTVKSPKYMFPHIKQEQEALTMSMIDALDFLN